MLCPLQYAFARPNRRQVIADEIAEMLRIKPGYTVAEVGAGNGAMAIRMARKVAPAGHVFATEIDPARVNTITKRARKAGIGNLTAVAATPGDSGLPDGCCDAAYMIGVYHHLVDPAATDKSIFRALKPGARLLINDFPPTIWLALVKLKGVPANRCGHGVADEIVIDELTAAGFRRVTELRPWHPGFFIRDAYCLVFSKPHTAPEQKKRYN